MDITYDDIKHFISKYFGTKKQQIRALSVVLAALLIFLGSTLAYNKLNRPKDDLPEIVDKEEDNVDDEVVNTPTTPPTIIKPEDTPEQPTEKPVEKPKEDLITYGAPYEESREILFGEERIDDDSLEAGKEVNEPGTGVKGLETRSVRVKYVNGVEVGIEEVTPFKTVKEPIDLVVKVGTKPKAEVTPPKEPEDPDKTPPIDEGDGNDDVKDEEKDEGTEEGNAVPDTEDNE